MTITETAGMGPRQGNTTAADKLMWRAGTAGPRGKLSTERSRRCRERQKSQAQALEERVYSLRAEVAQLNVRLELAQTRCSRERKIDTSRPNCMQLVREYYNLLKFGVLPPRSPSGANTTANKFRSGSSRTSGVEITREIQCAFLHLLMEPDVQSFDCTGASAMGVRPVLAAWEAWTRCHASILLDLDAIDVVEYADVTVARTRCQMHVRTSADTVAAVFPRAVQNPAICAKLADKDMCYTLSEAFFFSPDSRVHRYTCDIDFAATLIPVLGNVADVLSVMNDQAPASTIMAQEEVMLPASPVPSASLSDTDTRLGMNFLLS